MCGTESLEIMCMKHSAPNHMQVHFIRVFIVCKSTRLGISHIQIKGLTIYLSLDSKQIKTMMAAQADSCLCYSHSQKTA